LTPFQDVYTTFIGLDKGWYKDAGIDLDLKLIPDWQGAQTLIAGGNIDTATSADADVIIANSKDRDVVFVLPLYQFAAHAVVVRPDEGFETYQELLTQLGGDEVAAMRATIEQLRGKTLLFSPSGTQTASFSFVAEKAGFDYPDDFDIQFIEEDAGLAAFLGGSGTGFTGGIPQLTAAIKRGNIILINTNRALPETVTEAGFSTSRVFLEENFDAFVAWARVMFRGLQLIQTDPDDGFGIISSHLAEAGIPLSPEELAAVWNNLEFFPESAEVAWRTWVCPSGEFYWRVRWESVIEQFLKNGDIEKHPGDLDDMFRVDDILTPILEEQFGPDFNEQLCGK
jgi:ABC-type nitrate/sulfonate/bicarbonate transport system substrate-binding protein